MTAALELQQWILGEGLAGSNEARVLDGVCERLTAEGIPLLRVNIAQPTLHPVIGGHLFIWQRDKGPAVQEDWRRNVTAAGDDYTQTPFAYMMDHDLFQLRFRLGAGEGCSDFPMLTRFRQGGATDYFALRTDFGGTPGQSPARRAMTSWLTDAPQGFTPDQIATIEAIGPALALVVKAASSQRVASSVIETYLGRDAGGRVLGGSIERGAGETIRAALWSSDLRAFTKISDSVPRDRLLGLLHDYFDCIVGCVHENGGQVLKFMGDGLLAIFNLEDDAASCQAALAAADLLRQRLEALSLERREKDLPVTGAYLALHLGDVLYGNIGAPDRLDFTVIGPAVNEVARIEAMCRALDQDLVISAAFAAAAKSHNDRIASLGRYVLRGVRRPQELFTLVAPEDL